MLYHYWCVITGQNHNMKKINKSFENVTDQNVWEQQKEVETMLVIKVRTGRVHETLIIVQNCPVIFSYVITEIKCCRLKLCFIWVYNLVPHFKICSFHRLRLYTFVSFRRQPVFLYLEDTGFENWRSYSPSRQTSLCLSTSVLA